MDHALMFRHNRNKCKVDTNKDKYEAHQSFINQKYLLTTKLLNLNSK